VAHNQQLDDPAVNEGDDEFNRWRFSERLADTIANFDASGGAPVIGIYGKWGSGKTSVLNFLKASLADKHGDKVVLHPFNPWLFKDPETLLQSFFAELGRAMQKSSKTFAEKVGKALQDYSGLFGLIPGFGSGASKLAEQGGKALTKSMEEVRDQVFTMMREADRKVVVLIDDLDRLDRDEVLQMLKWCGLRPTFPAWFTYSPLMTTWSAEQSRRNTEATAMPAGNFWKRSFSIPSLFQRSASSG
jgi:predicted KAP-like P-loop ATPase